MTGTGILLTTLGGITLLLWGCRMVRTGVTRAYGADLQQMIARWSDNRAKALGVGVAVGTALQSSTATALLLTGFVGQEAITVATALAILLGADFGAALAAAMFSSGISQIWPIVGFVGYLVHANFDGRSIVLKNFGRILIGLGLLLFGLQTIGGSAASLAQSTIVAGAIEAIAQEPLLAILIGAAITWLAHSSLAIVLLLIALATGGSISPEALYPVLLGINVGAALPAISATMTETATVRRVPLGNLIFRLAGAIAALPLLPLIADALTALEIAPAARIIVLHLAFNAALCMCFILLIEPVADITRRILPEHAHNASPFGPKFLDEKLLATPSAALGAATRETLRMGELVERMLSQSIDVLQSNEPALQAEVSAMDDKVDRLNEAIKLYLTKLMRGELSDEESQRAVDTIMFTTNLEHVGDIVDNNLMDLAEKKREIQVHFSGQGMAELRTMHARILDTMHLSFNVFVNQQADSARQLIARKTELRSLELEGTESHIDRLTSGRPESVATSAIHLDVMRDFKRINSHLTSVAYPVLERAGQLRNTRLKKVKVAKPSGSAEPAAR
ncbi:MAG: Na/Pi cotransporter family protein [Hyphomicrobiaceae bacterium]